MNETSQMVKVARNLTAITELYADLLAQAIHKAGAKIEGHSLPGGEAMVALAHVADRETNERRVALREQEHLANCARLDHTRCWTGTEDEDGSEPVLQTLLFWSEQWRAKNGFPLEGRRPTVATEVNVLRSLLDWAWDNLREWDDFAKDLADARTKLENLLTAGARTERGVPCLSCNVELIRPTDDPVHVHDCSGHDGICYLPHDVCPHDRGGLRDEWFCPSCERRYDEETYRRAVAHAAFVEAQWLPLEDAISRTGAKRGSIQGWATRGHVRKRKDPNTGRMTYNVADIQSRVRDSEEAA
jgi:hypothetical protein